MFQQTKPPSPQQSHHATHCVRPGLSAELYRNFSEHLDMPPESDMPPEMRYEIYLSQIVYLRNLMGQCFESFNRQFDGGRTGFSHHELATIHHSFLVTRDLIRECILKSMTLAADRHAKRFLTRHDHPCEGPTADRAMAENLGEPA